MLKKFQFEKIMRLGKRSYIESAFLEAEKYFKEAVQYYPNDFRVNFWLARTLFMSGQNDLAFKKFNECRLLRPDLGKELIDQWINIAINEADRNLSEINRNSDAILESLSLRKNIRLFDILSFVFWVLLIEVIVDLVVIKIFRAELSIAWRHMERSLVSVPFLALLFYKKTVLPENYLGAIRTRIEKLKKFRRSKYFNWWMWGTVLGLILTISVALIHPVGDLLFIKYLFADYGLLYVFFTLITGVLRFGIILQGGLFTYLKPYNRLAAYAISTLLQSVTGTNLIRVLFTMAYLFLYEITGSLSVVIVLSIIEGSIVVTALYMLTLYNLF